MKELTQPVISIKNIHFNYQDQDTREALSDVSLDVYEGEWLAIIGHNGSGKSTLAKMMNGLLEASSGEIYIDGQLLTEDTVYEARRKVGMVFQNPDNQIVAAIVEEDVAFGPENLGVPAPEIRQRVDAALASVNMSEYALHGPHLLSGGQKQRIAIAGVLAMKPKCIILDEPTAMLDPKGRKEVMDTVYRLNKEEGITIVFITHFMEEAALADRIIVMKQGEVIDEGAPKEVFMNVDTLKGLGLDVPVPSEIAVRLQDKGIAMPSGITTNEELGEALCQFN